MKTKINIFKFILSLIAVVTFFSCDNPVALGTRLDILGPVITITSPVQRQSVPVQFEMEGTAEDYSGVNKMIIKAVTNNQDFPRQWRYNNSAWEISDDYGTTWSPFANAQWIGSSTSASWNITVDMLINGVLANEGEYTFNVQAWDNGGFSDDNSFKAVVVIIDLDPPRVDITNPYLYRSINAYETDTSFKNLHDIADSDNAKWQDPAYLGKFITQEFSLKWQIEDINEVWSIDLRFYKYDTVIDNNPDTSLPDNYIYRYSKNLPPPPATAAPGDYVMPNGSVTVPDLNGPVGFYESGGELRTSIPEKTTIKVVAVCYDAAGNPNQEKTLGYFISWPKANSPWITFTEGIESPNNYYGKQVAYDDKKPDPQDYIEDSVFTVYPGRSIKATAFQAHGVKEVKYSLYKCNISNNTLNSNSLNDPSQPPFDVEKKNIIVNNTAYGGTYSTIFPWELQVPPFTGYYIFEAEAFSSQGKPSEKYTMLFRVHDITFPDFIEGPLPTATDPLFMTMSNNKITISGTVSDATDVVSLCMVWINPNSEGYAAMSQLSYFRNNNYAGWKEALTLAPGGQSKKEEANTVYGPGYPYDSKAPNRLWNLNLTPAGMDYDTNRHLFNYSREIDITDDLNIGPETGLMNLKSQVFLFRAQNPDGKCTVVTYAPQGDTLSPVITISNVIIQQKGSSKTFYPNTYDVVPQFDDNDTITINGTWWEDSVKYLDIERYFLKNFEITVNNQSLSKLVPGNITGVNTQEGTWTITTTVGSGAGKISKDKLKDTLVIGVNARDIGGNESEAGSSWLIQSDNLRLMRISSEAEDGIYKASVKPDKTDRIKIFLEFSKPVKITNSVKPELILSSNGGNAANDARAVYMDGQDNYNSRQYFEYTVKQGDSTGTEYLNVKGLYYNGVVYSTTNPPVTGTYPFTWSRGAATTGDYEEVRITMIPGHKGDNNSAGYYVRTLPTATSNTDPDYQFTLTAGKHIKIDTTPPTAIGVAADTNAGHYKSGDISIKVTFSKEVTTGATKPSLALAVTNGAVTSSNTDTTNIKVNGNTITFVYRIKTGDTTNGSQVSLTGVGYSGDIIDLAGNALSGNISGTLTGLYIDTIPLSDPPVVKVLDAVNNQIGISGGADVDLKNIYNDKLLFAVERGDPSGGSHRFDKFEYSINNGTSWLTVNNSTPFDQPSSMTAGSYTIIARQINKAGNVSPESKPVKLIWDPGDLISRISSTSANGTYTNTTGYGGTRVDTIPITVTFRKNVKFSTMPTITINTTPSSKQVNVTGYTPGTSVSELTFNYQVGQTDNTSGRLDVTSFNLNGSVAQDESGVDVSYYFNLPKNYLLKDLKDITIQTGSLSVSNTTFDNSKITGGGVAADGSYNTALVITFSKNIFKGVGDITIIQSATGYRLPAVLTESQFSRFSGISKVNDYYTRGANGYINGSGADTSIKYILNYTVDPTNENYAPGTIIETKIFAEAFRQAEKVKLSINANNVKISGNQLIVELTGSNALQVPGASYQVFYSKGLVQDNLSTPCAEVTETSPLSPQAGGIAKPFIRINKRQEIISTITNPSLTRPRLTAEQPFQAGVRMDCRTPGSTIYYFTTQTTTNITTAPGVPGNWTYNANPASNGPNDLTNPAAPGRPSDPQTTQANRQTYSTALTIGTAGDYQGLQWYVRTKANKGSDWSENSEEMAFKTVVTYDIRSMTGTTTDDMTGTTTQIRPGTGDQIWIRGGDAISSSSVPGFPLTWDINEFSRVKEEGKRAGIRLFTCTSVTTNFSNSSTWKWITWDINTDAYYDIILGKDTTSTAAEAQQYGPRQFAYQRAGWTAFKEQSRILPGKHRWFMDDGNNFQGRGQLNFSATFNARPSFTGSDITYTLP